MKNFEKILYAVALFLICFALLKNPEDPKSVMDGVSYWSFVLGVVCVLIAIFGRRTLLFIRSFKKGTERTEDPTIDSFQNNEEWKEFVSDGSI